MSGILESWSRKCSRTLRSKSTRTASCESPSMVALLQSGTSWLTGEHCLFTQKVLIDSNILPEMFLHWLFKSRAISNDVYSDNNRWLIQVPRLYDIYRANNNVKNFQDIIRNLFQVFHNIKLKAFFSQHISSSAAVWSDQWPILPPQPASLSQGDFSSLN